jgi:hypothetical protein
VTQEILTKLWSENLKGREHLGHTGVNGRIILKWISKKYRVDWIHLAEYRAQWQALVKAVMTLGFHKRWVIH